MTELKPCPFCNGEAELEADIERHNDLVRVICKRCGIGTLFCNTKLAIHDWNKRWDEQVVIHCKECKYCEERKTANGVPFDYCNHLKTSVSGHFYCIWGRKEQSDGTN